MQNPWCHVCCTRHGDAQKCPGELNATDTEAKGWRINVDTGQQIEAFGVLLALCDDLWRARILTYPRTLWVVPGGHASMKFVGRTADKAEEQAIQFIRGFCRHRGYHMRGHEGMVGDVAEQARGGMENRRLPRTVRFHEVHFGVGEPVEPGGTGDLSESGLFILTENPPESGSHLNVSIRLAEGKLRLSGRVRWVRKKHHQGCGPGMGIQIDSPTEEYLAYVRSIL